MIDFNCLVVVVHTEPCTLHTSCQTRGQGTCLLTTGVTIKVVDPKTYSMLPEGEEGEIWVDSKCKALGYWEKDKKSQRVFEAQLDDSSDQTYLRTGDLGFMKDGELFVSGRLKNLIIVHGRKIHPSDIEMRIESSFNMLQPGRSVACEYKNELSKDPIDSKGIAYVAELRSPKSHSLMELHSLSKQISLIIGLNFQVEAHLVVFINPRTLPCTTSGKRQRSLCKKKLINNALEEVCRWSRVTEVDIREQQSPATLPEADQGTAVLATPNISVESAESTAIELLTPPDITILEPSDSESNLKTPTNSDSDSEPKATKSITSTSESEQDVTSNSTIKTLKVQYPDIVRTERRRSAPPLPVDRESQLKASNVDYQRRRSAVDKSASISRLYRRRNSLKTLTDTVSGILGVQLQPDSNIWAYGCNSVKVVQLSQCLQSEFGFAVEPHHLFMHQTPKALMGRLQRSLLSMSSPPMGSNQADEQLAVVEDCGGPGLGTLHEDIHEGQDKRTVQKNMNKTTFKRERDIAIVGMACTCAGKLQST